MHELGLTQEIVAIACERARREGERTRVTRIVVEIGKLSGALPQALAACFELCAEGTAAEGAALELLEVDGIGRCLACGAQTRLDRPFGVCACGGSDLEWLSGLELKVKRMEVIPCA